MVHDDRMFLSLKSADDFADGMNNYRARWLATTWGCGLSRKERAKLVLDYFKTDGFYIVEETFDINDGTKYYTPVLHKLSEEEYNRGIQRLNDMDANGYNEADGELYNP